MAIARGLVRLSARIVPGSCRDEWRREWLAELEEGAARGRSTLRFALGAPVHALALRAEGWRPGPIAADLRFGVRMLRRRPGFAAAAIVTLALGIGATTTLFSVVYGVLLAPLPYRAPDRLVQLWETNPLFNWNDTNRATVAPGNLLSWRERNHVFQDIAWYLGSASREAGLTSVTLGGARPQRLQAVLVSANFFDVLGVGARLGRTFAAGEDLPGHEHEVVLADGLWRAQFGADPSVLGRTVTLNGVGFTVIGVMAPSFEFDRAATDLWVPLAMDRAQARDVRRPHYFRAIARLRPGVTIGQARADLVAIATDLAREYPDTNRQMSVNLGPLDDWFVGQTRRPLWLFMAAVGFVLLMACANVTNLLLSRTSERVREMSLRTALGAGRGRLVRQLLVECLVIASVGTVVGVALAFGALRAFVRLSPPGLPRLDNVSLHPAVLVFAVALTGLTTLLVGLWPAFQAARRDPRAGLGDDGRVTPGRGRRFRQLAVGAEVALAVVLLVGAMLTLRSFRALVTTDPGIPVDRLASAKVALPAVGYGEAGRADAFFETASARLRALPGIEAAGATARLPLAGSDWTGDLFIERQPDVHYRELRHKSVTVGYLEAVGLPLVAGRTIRATDQAGAPPVVVANEALARRFFPAGDAVGQRIAFDQPGAKVRWRTIVGVVGNEPQDGLGEPAVPEVYDASPQEETRTMAFVVRSPLPPVEVASDIRQVVRGLDPSLAVYDAAPFTTVVDHAVARPRFAASVIALFAGVALVLAAVGVYGVAAYAVSARTREIGVRVAFGATSGDVLRLVVGQQLRVVVLGLIAGAGLALAGSRAVASLLFGTRPTDPASYALAIGLLFLAGLAASVVPVRRALRVDPVTALRAD
jgi:putative ABC transport system permease protein